MSPISSMAASRQPYPGEDRVLVPSPKVATYDLKPEMSAHEVTDKLVEAIRSRKYDAIVCNFANGDMVGHTGNLAAATRAIEVLDECVGRAVDGDARNRRRSADHGRPRQRRNDARPADTAGPYRAHAESGAAALYRAQAQRLRISGALQDVAPTLLAMMGLPQPPQMTGQVPHHFHVSLKYPGASGLLLLLLPGEPGRGAGGSWRDGKGTTRAARPHRGAAETARRSRGIEERGSRRPAGVGARDLRYQPRAARAGRPVAGDQPAARRS